ncbi:Uncharacterized protein Adt_25917 [Abeliophyllum distichum]|uniref:Uncharacterized protein n=1 Tax=Abeliophyllum distichum TaxID=126358 RepID=A0ABD1RQH9_9LAMI
MEMKNSLQSLIKTTWDLHVRINEKINCNGIKFCRQCSYIHGHYCVVADDTVEEREKMIAIRDSLQDVHNILIYLQRIESCQKTHRNAAIASLEEKRLLLIERVNQCHEKATKLDVLEELKAFFGNGKKTEFTWNFKEKKIEQKILKRISSFLLNTTRIGIELVVILACISSTVKFCNKRLQNYEPRREILAPAVDPREVHLDVLYGKG